MDNVFLLNSSADQLDIADAINERLKKAKAITQCLLATHNSETELSSRHVYDVIWAVNDYINEIEVLKDQFKQNEA